MNLSRRDRYGLLAGAEVDGGEFIAHLVRTIPAVIRIPLAKLSIIIVPPALDGFVAQQRAGMDISRRDRCGLLAGAEADGGEVIAHLVRTIPAVIRIALAELAGVIIPPAFELPII